MGGGLDIGVADALQSRGRRRVIAGAVFVRLGREDQIGRRLASQSWCGVAAFAGVLLSPLTLIDPNMGFIGIKAFAAAVLGGFGSIPGALIGGIIIGLVEQMAGLWLPAGFMDISAYLVLLIALVLRPEGIFAQVARKKV